MNVPTGQSSVIQSGDIGGFMGINSNGNDIILTSKEQATHWIITPTNQGNYLILDGAGKGIILQSENNKLGVIDLQNVTENSIMSWRFTNEGYLYSQANDGKKYIWYANEGLYSTPDAYLAEPWIIKPTEKLQPIVPNVAVEKESKMIYIIAAILLIALIFILSRTNLTK